MVSAAAALDQPAPTDQESRSAGHRGQLQWPAANQEVMTVKTMTCRQMGGPCDAAFHGTTADEVIKAQDSHLKEVVAGGDETHRGALKGMQDRWRHPISGMGWYRKAKKDFAALPED